MVFDLSAITIVSGGQTGADRAALDFAIENRIAHAGWCPRGRLAEDGPLSALYQLQETPSRKYAQRTEWNVRDSDATVVFTLAASALGGTALTLAVARRLDKPSLHLHPQDADSPDERQIDSLARRLLQFLVEHDVRRLNVAGPRASQAPEIGPFVQHVLQATLFAER